MTILGVVFLCGASVGSVVTQQFLHYRFRYLHPPPAIEVAQHFGLTRISKELQLTPAQEAAVAQELDDYAKYYQNIEEERADVAEHGKQRILSVLNDDQKKKFNAIFGPQRRTR